MSKRFAMWKILGTFPILTVPVIANSCSSGNKNNDRHYSKPTINQNLEQGSKLLITWYNTYIAQQKALGKKVSASPATFAAFYNEKDSNLFDNVALLANGYFHDFLTVFSSNLQSQAIANASAAWKSSKQQLTAVSNAVNKFARRFMLYLYSSAAFLDYQFQTNKDKLIDIKNVVGNLDKKENSSYITQSLLLLNNNNNNVTNDTMTSSNDVANSFLSDTSAFYINKPGTVANTNFLKVLLGNEWSTNPTFDFTPLPTTVPTKDQSFSLNFSFKIFDYKFAFTVKVTGQDNNALSFQLNSFKVTSD